MKCIGCGNEITDESYFILSGVGALCNVGSCYAEFNAKREKMLAESCYRRKLSE